MLEMSMQLHKPSENGKEEQNVNTPYVLLVDWMLSHIFVDYTEF